MVAIEVDLKLVVILILLIGSLIWRLNEEVNEKSLLQSDISKIKKTLTQLQKEMKTTVSQVQSETKNILTELQTENSEIKMTLTEVQRENSEIKMTLSQVQMEISDIKTTLTGRINKTLTQVLTECSAMQTTLTEVQREIKMTRSQVQMEISDMKTTLIGKINTLLIQRLDIILNSLRKTLTTMFLSFKDDTDMLDYKMDEMKDACSAKTSTIENILAILCALLKSPFLFGIGTKYLPLCDVSLLLIQKFVN